jgi:hypothetical protein
MASALDTIVALPTRLVEKIQVGDGCWPWLAHVGPDGYGRFRWQNRQRVAHRVVYELLVGSVPAGLQLDHLCRNRSCVRPDHLEPVTARENVRRSPIHVANRTHCPQGHPYDEVNTFIRSDGARVCKTCERWTGTGKGSFQRSKTHCPRGHPYDEVNTRITAWGRQCRVCDRDLARERRRARRG